MHCEYQGNSAESSFSIFFLICSICLPNCSWLNQSESRGWYETQKQRHHPHSHTFLVFFNQYATFYFTACLLIIIWALPQSFENGHNYWEFSETDIALRWITPSHLWEIIFSTHYTLKTNFSNYRINILT